MESHYCLLLFIICLSSCLSACATHPAEVTENRLLQNSNTATPEVTDTPVSPRPVRSLLEFRQKNVVMQEWDLSCGAAALTTLLRYQHGLDLTEKTVASALIKRQEYIDNPDLLKIKQGFSLLDLKRYVDGLGYPGNGYGRLDLNNLIKLAPIIVPVRLEGYNHFVVFRGVADKRVLLADPAWGNRTMSKERFVSAWMNLPKIGRVGFSVQATQPRPELNVLAPTDLDFVMLQ